MAISIAIVNACKILKDAQVAAIVPAIQSFDTEVLAPAWSLEPASYHFVPYKQAGKVPTDGSVRPIFLNNRSDTPAALGWHDDQSGKIFGRCFVGDCLRDHVSWTVDVTHEAFEMRVDPTIDREVTLPDGRIAMVEVGDPCEDDLYAIEWHGVKISDFVLPAYFFMGSAPSDGRYDYGKHLSGPCPSLISGGYQSLYVDGQWTQVTARRRADHAIPRRAYLKGRGFRHAGGTV